MSTNSTMVGDDTFWRLMMAASCCEARIRHGDLHNADIGLNGAKGEVLRFNARLGQRIEQGGFAYIGQAHDTAFKTIQKSL
jgi:hypothetical protein